MGKFRKRTKRINRTIKSTIADNLQDGEGSEELNPVMDVEDDHESDKLSTIYSTTSRMSVNNLTKKEKRQIKKENWARRIEAYYTTRKEDIQAAKRRKTPVVGDLQPLQMALPTLEELIRESQNIPKSKDEKTSKPLHKMKRKQRQRGLAREKEIFSQVLSHPAFSSDPLCAINGHLSMVVQSEKNQE
ncbi:uncharacterized protein TRIADDRAFT_54384 [Trichoplax adhaerens]|uniref:Ribosome biogenesis protein SLX9 n=1 Tax=Trichoplax adhaerens TaxID=10228 RepID=B3RRV8_TRIAD|nr:hypothetical protein TRIADDRAFT_54384 [Trichoplax adhaerens]EDV26938.1 hypothetical protein TRIADDRAFT_54384 [Trichoplax adhaerens]|eukprot:XP_002110934.1 hypothetical protein TRIADDRAFT_54384 [Trichoplax adhaerens]